MKFAFIDYKHPKYGFANRDMTGGFGSGMSAKGVFGTLVKYLKKNNIRSPILSFAYMAAIARSYKHEVNLYTNMPVNEEVIIIATSIHHYKYEIELAKKIKKKLPLSKIGFIGPFSSEKPDLFREIADFIVSGEPENSFDYICKNNYVPKGVFKSPRELNVNKLPFPDWDGFDLNSFGYSPALPRKPFLTIQGSRGCPFACEFCPYLVSQGVPLRRRSNDDIIEEIKYLIKKYKIKSLLFRDITWSMHKKETKNLCKLIINENFDLDIGVETRADTLDDELINLMKEAGIKSVNLGIESPVDEILISSGRIPMKENKLERAIDKLHKNNIQVQGFYILGLINDTEDSIKKTISYSKKINSFTAQFCVLTPFPGTKTYKDLEKNLITKDYSNFNEYTPVVKIKGVNPERISYYVNKAYNSYYFRFSWLKKHGFRALSGFFK